MTGMLLSENLRALHELVVISRLAEITDLDTLGVPVVSAIRPASRSLSVMSGRGTTLENARIAATMEAVEAHAAENFRPACTRARYRELTSNSGKSVPAIDPRTLPHAPGAQLDGELWWCTATGLLSGAEILIPFESVHTDWTRPSDPSGLALDSAGIGAGLDRDHAIRHGLLELIERDALTMATVSAIASGHEIPVLAPALTPQDLGPATVELAARLASAGAVVHLTDLRSDTGVPAIAAFVLDASPNPFRILPVAMGTAAAPNSDEAAVRAITEATQSRLVTISGARDDLLPAEYARMIDQQAEQLLRERLKKVVRAKPPETIIGVTTSILAATIQATTGHEPIVIDLAQYPLASDTVHVTRTLAPGLEGSGAQFGVVAALGTRATAAMEVDQ